VLKNLPAPFQDIVTTSYNLLRRVWPFFDSTPGLPGDGNVEQKRRGERIDIQKVAVLPALAVNEAPPADLWWMRLSGKWGSSHGRGFGVIGPDPPWRHRQWEDAAAWIEACLLED